MFGRSITLFRLFGFAVRVDLSWLIVGTLVAWSLADGIFPSMYPDLSAARYWGMGVAGAIILFLSIVVHEFAHSLIARRYGIPMKGITLFLFGGVAEMDDEPPSPNAELLMALAGPAMSLILAAIFGIAFLFASSGEWPVEITGVVGYLALINVVLVVFNMLPAFPLDGGRVLRAFLWMWDGNVRRATRIASWIGSAFGFILVGVGLVSVFFGNYIGGIWWFLIGLFLRNAAQMSYKQILLRSALQGERVTRFMNSDPITVQRSISIEDLVENYVYRHHFKMFPVLDDDRLVGCVTTRQIRQVPREEWARQSVGVLASACNGENSVAPDTDAMDALSQMMRTNNSRLMVVEGGALVGVISLKDLMTFLRLKLEIEDEVTLGEVPDGE